MMKLWADSSKVQRWQNFWCADFQATLLWLADDRQRSDFDDLEPELDLLHRYSPSTVDNVAAVYIRSGFIHVVPLTVELDVAVSRPDLGRQICWDFVLGLG